MATRFFNPSWLMPTNGNQSKSSNYSMEFNGTDEYIDIIDSAVVPVIFQDIGDNNSYSISAWIKTTGGASASPGFWQSYITIFELRQQATTNCTIPFSLGVSSNKLTFGRTSDYITDWDLVSSTTSVNDGDWHHVAIVIVDDAYTFYLDGAADGTGTFASATGDCSVGGTIDSNMQIGVRALDTGHRTNNYFPGKMDQVAIFDYALEATGDTNSVPALWNSGTPANPMSLANPPIAYYPLGDNTVYNGADYLVQNSSLQDYVFDFQSSSSQWIDLGVVGSTPALEPTDELSVSGWVKNDGIGVGQRALWACGPASGYMCWAQGTQFDAYIQKVDRSWVTASTAYSVIDVGEWYHVVMTWKASTGDINLYVNNSSPDTASGATDIYYNPAMQHEIGKFSTGQYMDGEISNVVIWDKELSAANVETLYNNGSPLKTLAEQPSSGDVQGWWKLDASATWDGSKWIIPDDSTNSNDGEGNGMTTANLITSDLSVTEAFEKYSLYFDGSGDYIDLGNVLASTFEYNVAFSISAWINVDNNALTYKSILTKMDSGPVYQGFQFQVYGDELNFHLINDYSASDYIHVITTGSPIIQHNWYHVVLTKPASPLASGVKMYVNGVEEAVTATDTITGTTVSTDELQIGARDNGNLVFLGNLSNITVFNSELSNANVQTLYNAGKPGDLSSFSPTPVSWWRLGENSFWNGSSWIVNDEIGTNTGTSTNMANSYLQGTAPLTYANGTSYSMAGDELKGEAKNSTSNSISENMSVIARVTDVPA